MHDFVSPDDFFKTNFFKKKFQEYIMYLTIRVPDSLNQNRARWGRESWLLRFVFLVSRDCCVALPHDATGLSAVCDCGIS